MGSLTVRATSEADLVRWRLPSFQRKFDGALDRVERALAETRQPYVALSGGKDSLVCLALAARIQPGITAIWSDDELEHASQEPYMRALCETLGVRLVIVTGHALHDGWFRAWTDAPYWRMPPDGAIPIPGLSSDWAREDGYDGVILGMRRQESARRRAHLSRGHTQQTRQGLTCNPIAWWTADEVWAAIAGLGLPYNPVYDRLTEIGVPRERQRVGPLPLSPGWMLDAGWRDVYQRLVARYGPHW